MNDSLLLRMKSDGPKKILACDGGGIRGLLSVEILCKLEADLRRQLGRPDLVLADWLDFVCGTSTGAIIAAGIATGMSMEKIRDFYLNSGEQMFDKASVFKRLRYNYNDEPLARMLRAEFNNALGYPRDGASATLGDPGLRSLLMMVMRNHTTDSPWPVSNNPLAKYNDRQRSDCNLNLPLWQLVRASTAAPTFFPPEVVTFAPNTDREYQFVFVDGAVTAYNNPAYLAFQMATAAPYRVHWQTGADQLLIISVGTGNLAEARLDLQADELWLLDHAKHIPSALMSSASTGWDIVCRTLGECRFGALIDHEIGDMVFDPETPNWTGRKLFTYLRYDPDLSAQGLGGLGLADIDPAVVKALDSVAHIAEIRLVGEAFASRHLSPEHLEGFL
jgi:uncharacterized protein